MGSPIGQCYGSEVCGFVASKCCCCCSVVVVLIILVSTTCNYGTDAAIQQLNCVLLWCLMQLLMSHPSTGICVYSTKKQSLIDFTKQLYMKMYGSWKSHYNGKKKTENHSHYYSFISFKLNETMKLLCQTRAKIVYFNTLNSKSLSSMYI